MRVIAKVLCQKCRDYFCFPFANRRRTSSWSDISFSSPLWWLALFFLLFLCFLEVVTGSSGWGSFSLFFLFLVEVVTTVSGSGDGDRVRFFLCFFLGGVAYVMNSSASSSSSLSTLTTCLLFLATDGLLSAFCSSLLCCFTVHCLGTSRLLCPEGWADIWFFVLASPAVGPLRRRSWLAQ